MELIEESDKTNQSDITEITKCCNRKVCIYIHIIVSSS